MATLSFTNCFPLTLVEQYVYTSGQCHVFLEAIQSLVKGRSQMLVATDPRHLVKHGWPTDHHLALHVFLELPNGEVLDAEGRRTRQDLLDAFGVKQGWSFEFRNLDDETPFGKPKPELVDALKVRLKDLGWSADKQPLCDRRLSNKDNFALVEEQSRLWWRQWQRKFKLPNEAHQTAHARWEGFSLANQKLKLGENPFHVHAHLPDMIRIKLTKYPEQLRELVDLLKQARHCDGKTPLHLMSESLADTNVSSDLKWPFLVGSSHLIQHLLENGFSDVLQNKANENITLAEMVFSAISDHAETLSLLNIDLSPLKSMVLENHLKRTLDTGSLPRPKVRL